jgi:hypothetical protein
MKIWITMYKIHSSRGVLPCVCMCVCVCVCVCVWSRNPEKGSQISILDYKRLWTNECTKLFSVFWRIWSNCSYVIRRSSCLWTAEGTLEKLLLSTEQIHVKQLLQSRSVGELCLLQKDNFKATEKWSQQVLWKGRRDHQKELQSLRNC